MESGIDFFKVAHEEGRGRKKKLDENKVRAIRKRLNDGVPQLKVAAEFGIAPSTVCAVNRRQIWALVQDEEEA